MKNVAILFLFCIGTLYSQPFTKINTGTIPVFSDPAGPGYSGVSWFDYDHDGRADILTNGKVLYRNLGLGQFAKVIPGFTGGGSQIGQTCADIDNDGDIDFFFSGGLPSGSVLYRNDGAGLFSLVTTGDIGLNTTNAGWGCAWGDYDNDGFVDLVIAAANGFAGITTPNRLLHNNGDGTFTRIDSTIISDSLAPYTIPSWSDFDNDGDLDAFIGAGPVSVLGPDFFYKNMLKETDTAYFQSLSASPMTSDLRNGQIVNWVDYDNDGDLDCYITNYGTMANDLYRNDGGTYSKMTGEQAGSIVTDAAPSLSSVWEDFDNDGDLDCFVTNDAASTNKFYANNGDGTFTSLSLGTLVTEAGPHYGAGAADYDNDGDIDLFISGASAKRGLYRNDLSGSNKWLFVRCTGNESNRSAIGTKVRVKATIGGNPVWQIREVSSQNSFNSQNDLTVHFGLGDATIIDSLVLVFPSGIENVYTSVGVNQRLCFDEQDSAVPMPLLPLNNATTSSNSMTIRWSHAGSGPPYHLQVGTNSSFSSGIVFDDSLLTDTSHILSGLTDGTTYYWRVQISMETIPAKSWTTVFHFSYLTLFQKITNPANPVVQDQFESGGGSWIDINNDGYLDLFVANGNLSNQNNSMYLNTTAGNFINVSTGSPVTDGGSSIGSTWGDYDRDGTPDFFVTNRQNFGNFLYNGLGDTNFTKIITGSVVTDIANSNSGSWVDVDGDGNLDLYVVNFQGNDYFYHNDGSPSYTFTRIDTLAMIADGSNFSISGSWADYNNDRKPDFFVGNAGTQNDFLYTNNGNLSFTQSVLTDGSASVGNSWGDYDNDGNLDLFVANTVGQNNVLYHNSGAPSYTLTAVVGSVVVSDGGNSVGSAWGDYDNDGDLDLYVANDGGNNFLYENGGFPNYEFAKITLGSIVNDGGNSFGCVWVDYDNDGALDLFVANRLNQKNFLYHNSGNANRWLELHCTGTASNISAIGTRILLKAAVNGVPMWQIREIQSQSGYNSENLVLHFGLGDASAIDSLLIQWPSGIDEVYTNVSPDQILTFVEGTPLTPNLIDAIPGNATVSLRWRKSLAGNFSVYRIYADTLPNPTTQMDSVTIIGDTTITVSGLINNKTYYFRITEVNTVSVESQFSNTVSSTPFVNVTRYYSVRERWNLVSLPLTVLDPAKSFVFPASSSFAYRYLESGNYQIADTLQTGRGYWLKYGSAQSIAVVGAPVHIDTISVYQGWNLIGSISDTVPASSITSIPPGMVTSNFFTYSGRYVTADTVYPSHGYWVKTDTAGFLILDGSVTSISPATIHIRATSEVPAPPPGDESESIQFPTEYSLEQSYPNPFNPSVIIKYQLPFRSEVTIKVYNVLGQVVATLVEGVQDAGYKSIEWNAGALASGIYLYRIEANAIQEQGKIFSQVRKMVLLK